MIQIQPVSSQWIFCKHISLPKRHLITQKCLANHASEHFLRIWPRKTRAQGREQFNDNTFFIRARSIRSRCTAPYKAYCANDNTLLYSHPYCKCSGWKRCPWTFAFWRWPASWSRRVFLEVTGRGLCSRFTWRRWFSCTSLSLWENCWRSTTSGETS